MATGIKTVFPVHDRPGQLFRAEVVKALLNIEVYLEHFSFNFFLILEMKTFQEGIEIAERTLSESISHKQHTAFSFVANCVVAAFVDRIQVNLQWNFFNVIWMLSKYLQKTCKQIWMKHWLKEDKIGLKNPSNFKENSKHTTNEIHVSKVMHSMW